MTQFFRILMFSPRLTVLAILAIFGAITGKAANSSDASQSRNAWSKQDSGARYSAQKRSDDGWGTRTRSVNPRDDGRAAVTHRKVWRDSDGVIYEEEDIKAFDRSEYE